MQVDTAPLSPPRIEGNLEAEFLRLLGRGDELEAVKLSAIEFSMTRPSFNSIASILRQAKP